MLRWFVGFAVVTAVGLGLKYFGPHWELAGVIGGLAGMATFITLILALNGVGRRRFEQSKAVVES